MTRPTDADIESLWAAARDSWDDPYPMYVTLRRAAQWVEDERKRADEMTRMWTQACESLAGAEKALQDALGASGLADFDRMTARVREMRERLEGGASA